MKVSSDFLLCRDMRHAWVNDGYLIADPDNADMVTRELKCVRCETHRIDHYRLNRRYHEVTHLRTSYRYPRGYQVPGGLNVRHARYTLFDRALDKEE